MPLLRRPCWLLGQAPHVRYWYVASKVIADHKRRDMISSMRHQGRYVSGVVQNEPLPADLREVLPSNSSDSTQSQVSGLER